MRNAKKSKYCTIYSTANDLREIAGILKYHNQPPRFCIFWVGPEMCSERDSPLEPFVLPAPGQPELARLICGAHLGPPVLTRKQKRPRVNSLVCDRAAAFCAAGPPEVLSRMSRPVTQAAERERELARARSQRLNQAAPSLPGESVSRGFADRGALEGYPSHYTSLVGQGPEL